MRPKPKSIEELGYEVIGLQKYVQSCLRSDEIESKYVLGLAAVVGKDMICW